jgi:hypothetical protein
MPMGTGRCLRSGATSRPKRSSLPPNAYTAGVLPEYKQVIHPVRGVCSRITATDPPTRGELQSLVPWYGPGLADYQVYRADGSVVVGGAWPSCRNQHQDQWYDIFDESKTIPAATGYFDDYMQRTCIDWKESDAKIDRYWSGIMGVRYDPDPDELRGKL